MGRLIASGKHQNRFSTAKGNYLVAHKLLQVTICLQHEVVASFDNYRGVTVYALVDRWASIPTESSGMSDLKGDGIVTKSICPSDRKSVIA